MRLGRTLIQAFLKKSATFSVATALIALTIGVSTLTLPSNVVIRTAIAMPAGFFFLQLQGDSGPQGVMDVEDAAGRVTGHVQLNTPILGKDSQLWKERFPSHGTVDVIRLENKATGQCLADSDSDNAKATIRPCGDEKTLWHKVRVGGAYVLRRTTELSGWYSDLHSCAAEHPDNPGFVTTVGCPDLFPAAGMSWDATMQPVGAVSSGLSSDASVTPPRQPTNCKVVGSGGNCGLIDFTAIPILAPTQFLL
jgi:hypothetical protein